MEHKIYIDQETKDEIKKMFKKGIDKHSLARYFGFSRTTIMYILDPEHRKMIIKKSKNKNREKIRKLNYKYFLKNKKEISLRKKENYKNKFKKDI